MRVAENLNLKPKRAHVALFMALAAFLQAAETVFPTPAPWFRLGLGNALVLAALVLWGARSGGLVAAGKVVVGSLVTGRLLSPAFILAAGGTAAATVVMAAALGSRLRLGFVGVSVLGGSAHALVQLVLARYLFLDTGAVWALAPVVGGAAVVSAIVTGVAAGYLARVVERELTAKGA
jgi:heptaprenyl diphosphate synthase